MLKRLINKAMNVAKFSTIEYCKKIVCTPIPKYKVLLSLMKRQWFKIWIYKGESRSLNYKYNIL